MHKTQLAIPMPHLSPREIAFEYETRQQTCVCINDYEYTYCSRAPSRIVSSSKIHQERSERFGFLLTGVRWFITWENDVICEASKWNSQEIRCLNEFSMWFCQKCCEPMLLYKKFVKCQISSSEIKVVLWFEFLKNFRTEIFRLIKWWAFKLVASYHQSNY